MYREIYEEIGVKITQFTKWVTRKYSYGGNDVTLHFFKVQKWEGEVTSKEKQKLVWTYLQEPNVSPILPANQFIQKGFNLPKYYAITNLAETSKKVFFTMSPKDWQMSAMSSLLEKTPSSGVASPSSRIWCSRFENKKLPSHVSSMNL